MAAGPIDDLTCRALAAAMNLQESEITRLTCHHKLPMLLREHPFGVTSGGRNPL